MSWLLECTSEIGFKLQMYLYTFFEQNAYAAVSIPCEFYRHSIKFTPWFQTAGFGVFAGRAFKQDEPVMRTWKTLYLPYNMPRTQVICNYIFGHNETHTALVIDYGSLCNHHDSPNAKAVTVHEPVPNTHFQVRTGFECANRNVLKICIHACMHATDTR